jgi:1-acyl-sn-glycerol-3-phosphate acyltransferase
LVLRAVRDISGAMVPGKREITALERQKLLAWLAFPCLSSAAIFYMRVVRGNRVRNHAQVRRRFRELVRGQRQIVICANHLTMIDSFFVHWALCSPLDYFRNYRLFAWNVPATENFQRGLLLRLMSYLGKTVAIDRSGSANHHRAVLGKLAYLVQSGDLVTIFPEAGRSRTGRVEPEQVAYGIGRILRDAPDTVVLCVYLRGDRQRTWGFQPVRGDRIHVDLELLVPATSHTGLRASRDLSRQVIERIRQMEERYFAAQNQA